MCVAQPLVANDLQVVFYLNNHTTRHDLVAAVKNISYGGYPPNLAAALAVARSKVFVESNGARQRDPSVLRLAVVFLTATPSTYRESTLEEARRAAEKDIGIVVVSVSTFVDRQLLSSIATYPTSKNLFIVPSMIDVFNLVSTIKAIICSGKLMS